MARLKHVVFVSYGAFEARRWRRARNFLKVLPELSSHEFHLLRSDEPLPELSNGKFHLFRSLDSLSCGLTGLFHRLLPISLEKRASRLKRLLSRRPFSAEHILDDPETTLIASGCGCRVVQKSLLDLVNEAGDARPVHSIRNVIFVNPRRFNLLFVLLFAAILSLLVSTVLELAETRSLLPLDYLGLFKPGLSALAALLGLLVPLLLSTEALSKLGIKPGRFGINILARDFESAIMSGSKTRYGTWPIPFSKVSLGYHFNPRNDDDLHCVAQAIVNGSPHPCLYDIELLERYIKSRPCNLDDVPANIRELRPPDQHPALFGNNRADYRISVRFSGNNFDPDTLHPRPWTLRYGTTHGLICVDPLQPDNLWEPKYLADYEKHHHTYEYVFLPERHRTYALQLKIYGGYTGAEQKSHTHLRSDAYFHCVSHILDLSDWIECGWSVDGLPSVTFVQARLPLLNSAHSKQPRRLDGLRCDCDEREERDLIRTPLPVQELKRGVFQWDVRGVLDGGIIAFRYSLVKERRATIAASG